MAKLCLNEKPMSQQALYSYSNPEAWYALRVRCRGEHNVARMLDERGFNSFVPTWQPLPQAGKVAPGGAAFPGYLFVRFALPDLYRVLNAPGVQQVIGYSGPAKVEDETIETLQKAFANRTRVHPAEYLQHGDLVEVTRGPMRGATGLLVRAKDALRLVIQVDILQRSVYTEVDADAVVRLKPTSVAA
jgi:transcription antitermination factor NusG